MTAIDNAGQFLTWFRRQFKDAVKQADANDNGKIDPGEEANLGEFAALYQSYQESGRTVKTRKFIRDVMTHTRMSARAGGFTPDLAPHYTKFLQERLPFLTDARLKDLAQDQGINALADKDWVADYQVELAAIPPGMRSRLEAKATFLDGKVRAAVNDPSWAPDAPRFYEVRTEGDYPVTVAYAVVVAGTYDDWMAGGYMLLRADGAEVEWEIDWT